MYKLRFTKWELVKHNRESDMAVVVRKKRSREAEGKQSTFFLVHTKEVSVQEIERYTKRKRMSDTNFAAAPTDKATPTHIICLTPPDSPYPEELQDNSIVLAQQNTYAAADAATSTTLGHRRRVSSPSPVTSNSHVVQQCHRRIRAWAQSPSLPCVVTSPDVLRRQEMLFADIWSYVQGSISNGTWYLDSNGYLLNLQRGSVDAPEFAHLCYEATKLFRRSSAAQGRRLLSKAFSLLKPLLKEEDPWLLQNLMSTMIRLKQNGHVDICAMIQNYIAELATIVLREKPLWRRICISICHSDPEHTELLSQSWCSLTDAFADVPGVDGRLTYMSVMNKAELTYRLYRSTEPERAESLLRGILAEYEQKMQMMDDTAMYVIARLADVLHAQRKDADVELLVVEDALLRAREAGLLSTAREADFMEVLAQAQHRLFKDDLAEESIRKAIALYADRYVRNDPCIIGCRRDLESWLRDWGRDAEADQLSAVIDQMIGPDDIDMDTTTPPHYPAEMTTSQRPNHTFQRDLSPQRPRPLQDHCDERQNQYHQQKQIQSNHTAKTRLQYDEKASCLQDTRSTSRRRRSGTNGIKWSTEVEERTMRLQMPTSSSEIETMAWSEKSFLYQVITH
jgi:hypothetical protein